MDAERLLTTAEVAARWKCSTDTVDRRRTRKRNRLRAIRVGDWRFRLEDVIAFEDRNANAAAVVEAPPAKRFKHLRCFDGA